MLVLITQVCERAGDLFFVTLSWRAILTFALSSDRYATICNILPLLCAVIWRIDAQRHYTEVEPYEFRMCRSINARDSDSFVRDKVYARPLKIRDGEKYIHLDLSCLGRWPHSLYLFLVSALNRVRRDVFFFCPHPLLIRDYRSRLIGESFPGDSVQSSDCRCASFMHSVRRQRPGNRPTCACTVARTAASSRRFISSPSASIRMDLPLYYCRASPFFK